LTTAITAANTEFVAIDWRIACSRQSSWSDIAIASVALRAVFAGSME